jgi:branched-chain amino acid transport system ATP-binding protein
MKPARDAGAATDELLGVRGLRAGYGGWDVLEGIDLSVAPGEAVGVLGHNGAGKSTLLRCIAGLLAPSEGTIRYSGEDIRKWPVAKRVRNGLVLVPQGRGLFREMSIKENVSLGAFCLPAARVAEAWREISGLWPWLAARESTLAGRLSGGQQQIVANARGLASQPRLLMVDEPSVGLSGVAVAELASFLSDQKSKGGTIILVEQNVGLCLGVCDRFLIMKEGRIVGDFDRATLPVGDLWELF